MNRRELLKLLAGAVITLTGCSSHLPKQPKSSANQRSALPQAIESGCHFLENINLSKLGALEKDWIDMALGRQSVYSRQIWKPDKDEHYNRDFYDLETDSEKRARKILYLCRCSLATSDSSRRWNFSQAILELLVLGDTGYINDKIFAILALSRIGLETNLPQQLANIILKNQKDDGGFGIMADSRTNTDITAAAIIALKATSSILQINYNPEIRKAVDYLLIRQNQNGGFGFYNQLGTNTSSTAWALGALCALEQKIFDVSAPIDKATEFLLNNQFLNGGWSQVEGIPASPWVTAYAILALKSAYTGEPFFPI